MDRKWERLDKQTIFACPYYALSHDRYRRPDGDVGDYHYIDILGSTMVVPVTAQGKLVLTRQYRYLMGRWSLEFPCGGLKAGYEALYNAQQELREEAGYVAARWERIAEFAPYNGVSNEMCQLFVAGDLTIVAAAPEPTEEIDLVVALSGDEVSRCIARGELWDGMTISAFALYERWSGRT